MAAMTIPESGQACMAAAPARLMERARAPENAPSVKTAEPSADRRNMGWKAGNQTTETRLETEIVIGAESQASIQVGDDVADSGDVDLGRRP